jgi:Predicted signal transduction protein with a C-terminal ATPase domain
MIIMLVMIPLVGVSTALYNYYYSLMKEEIGAANINALSRVRDMVDMVAFETYELSLRIARDPDVSYLMSNPIKQVRDYETITKIHNIYSIICAPSIASSHIDSIYVYSEMNDYLVSSINGGIKPEQTIDNDWYKDYVSNKVPNNFQFKIRKVNQVLGESNPRYLISSFCMVPLDNEKKTGAVVINISPEKLGRWITDVSNKSSENIFIVNGDGEVLYNSDKSIISKNIHELPLFKDYSMEEGNNPLFKDANGEKEAVSIVRSKYNDWVYVSVVPIMEYQKKTNDLKSFMVVFILICIIIAVIFAFIISARIFEPLKSVISIVENPEEWIDSSRINSKTNLNEFKYIASNIINSYGKGRQMQEELTYRMSLLRKAQAIALQSQINPHFLYNTLETVNWKAKRLIGGENEVSDMVASLSGLLRLSLETKNNIIDIRTEIEHARLYVEIQKARYEDKFDVIWYIDDSILENKITKITLQPLIENAIYHGIKPKKGSGIITITGYSKDDGIVIEVADDGVGMESDELDLLNSRMKEELIKEDVHIALRNVNQRIRLTFGDKYGLLVVSMLNMGTVVKIIIPVVK